MNEHRYTVAEIDALTAAVRKKYFTQRIYVRDCAAPVTASMVMTASESAAAGERLERMTQDKVRTFMLAGIRAEDVESADDLPAAKEGE